ncbi:hypothetical protein [Hyperthermus butylicus]|uniref:Uncharacterized protein n=1 Tax=Hyperthermus butylicus (strain DSM 5456 / JCM 9403 / PLM1-5) TaxID=415426 RepID=A2BJL2_HYPBU|nr:hypothetical protein [Hyperthermus butylicus]ABM80173.1 hypothetical protein Hbut_0301 [Hyperthermus butylicus DSM 5456]
MEAARDNCIVVTVRYCDDHIGYTAASWLEEFREIIEQEYSLNIIVVRIRDCSTETEPTIVVEGYGQVEGLPSDPGYLYEWLKKLLDQAAQKET